MSGDPHSHWDITSLVAGTISRCSVHIFKIKTIEEYYKRLPDFLFLLNESSVFYFTSQRNYSIIKYVSFLRINLAHLSAFVVF